MKNQIFTFILLAVVVFQSTAQITLGFNANYFPGDQFIVASDTNVISTLTPGNPGPNQTWNFSDLNESYLDTIDILNASETLFFIDFPTSNVAYEQDSNFIYGKVTNNLFTLQGYRSFAASQEGDLSKIAFIPESREAKFPFSYLDTIRIKRNFSQTFPGNDFGLPFDSVRIAFRNFGLKTADAWGNVIIGQVSKQCLRIIETATTELKFEGLTFGFWTELNTETSNDVSYAFIAEDLGFPFVTIFVDQNGEVTDVDYVKSFTPSSLSENTSSVKVDVFPNPASNSINISSADLRAATAEIFDMQGKLVHLSNFTGSLQIETETWTAGTYLIDLKNSSGRKVHQKKIQIIH